MLLRFPWRGHRRVPRLPELGLPAVPTWSTIFGPNFSHDSLWDNEFELSQTGLLADIRGPRTLGAKYLSFWEGTIGSQCIAVGKISCANLKVLKIWLQILFEKNTIDSQMFYLCTSNVFTRKLLLRWWFKVAPVWFCFSYNILRVRKVIKEAIMCRHL